MNRDKVLELAQQAELVRQLALEVPFVVDRLERFAALIEREVREELPKRFYPCGINGYKKVVEEAVAEVRGDAEPVGYMNPYQRLTEKDCYRFSTMPSIPLPRCGCEACTKRVA